ncbi:MAG: sulfur oxidation protein, flavocytochrome C [Rhodanobacter sp.]|nr:MAG: sulfur oxidation protein, flavocytochrome C [Rhodanobacter sp.]TAM13730.1 MAG: sulfur oxidation protein, flavocytochrome C [Rhodanobacter sp.]TAM35206.1 MAG: sulfur oxidation protein, flavocytochrome C [Rhodanobacter sp.]
MTHEIDRRHFLKMSGTVLAAAPAVLAAGPAALAAGVAQPAGGKQGAPFVSTHRMLDLPKARGPRLVIIGGGTSGLTIAKHAKKAYPKFDVVLVEKRCMYSSCFASNLWYPGIVNLEFLADHSFLDAAHNGGYIYVNATCIGLDRASRTVATNEGDIKYDFLVVAPGISYDYDKIGVHDIDAKVALRQTYPGGFICPTEHVTIHRKVHQFEGGVFIQTVPSGNYRCLPAPYERACLIASVIKHNKLKGKVVILDANPEITIKAPGFHAAFDELYKGIIEWHPTAAVTGVDVAGRTVHTEFDSYKFDDAAIYPNVRAATLIEELDLMAPPTKSNQKEANIDIRFYNLIGDQRVYVTGDSRPMPYSKSGNTSNSEGHYVAKVLAARAQGKDIAWTSPQTLCYSMVDAFPKQAIWVDTYYGYDAKKDAITGFKDTKVDNKRSEANGTAYLEWARGLYRDMFKA